MTKVNLPDGFIGVFDARNRHGKALYGRRWRKTAQASEDQHRLGSLVTFAAGIHADEKTIKSLGEGVIEAAGKSWKYRARAVTDILDWLRSGDLRGYLFRQGVMPELQPADAWQDQALVDALSSGYVTRGAGAPYQVIVREDDLQSLLASVKVSKPEQPPKLQKDLPKLRGQVQAWLEKITKVKARYRDKKDALYALALVEFGPDMSRHLFDQAWSRADLEERYKKAGPRPS